jgi:hypothetical protein
MAGETPLQKHTRRELYIAVGGYWRKIWAGPYQSKGVLDIVGCCQGIFFALETKNPKKWKLDPLQKNEMQEIEQDGKGATAVIFYPWQAVSFVKQTLDRHGLLQAAIEGTEARRRLADQAIDRGRRRRIVLGTGDRQNNHITRAHSKTVR